MRTAERDPDHTIRANIRAEMARRDVSQKQLAGLLGLSEAAVSHRMRGQTKISSRDLLAIADVLDVPPATLLDGAA